MGRIYGVEGATRLSRLLLDICVTEFCLGTSAEGDLQTTYERRFVDDLYHF